MKGLYHILLMLFVFTQIANSQEPDTIWLKSYPAGIIVDIKKTNDYGYIIAGSNRLLKLDINGNTTWTFPYDSISIGAVCIGTNDSYVAVGQTGDSVGLIKIDKSGNFKWSKFIQIPDIGTIHSIYENDYGEYYIGGNINVNDGDYWVLKLNAQGNIIWNYTFGGSISTYGPAFEASMNARYTLDNGLILIGHTTSTDITCNQTDNATPIDGWVTKVDSSGNIDWSSCIGNPEFSDSVGPPYALGDYGKDVIQTYDGGFVAIGTGDFVENQAGHEDEVSYYDIGVTKFDIDGNVAWEKPFGIGPYHLDAYALSESTDSNLLVLNSSGLRILDSNGDSTDNISITGSQIMESYEHGYLIAQNDTLINIMGPPILYTPQNHQRVNNEEGQISFNIISSINWTVTESESWLTVDSTSGFGSTQLQITYEQNHTGNIRTGNIYLSGETTDTLKLQIEQPSSYFVPVYQGNPYQPMSILCIAAIANNLNLKKGDEIGVFCMDSLNNINCVGNSKLKEPLIGSNPLLIKASTDDPTTEEIDGFVPGNNIYYQIWDSTNQILFPHANVNYNTGFDTIFNSLGTAIVSLNGYGHYKPAWSGNPYQPMTLSVKTANICGDDLLIGDEIGVFYIDNSSDSICVGSGIVLDNINTANPLIINLSEDNPSTTDIDGFIAGNELHFQLWDTVLQLNYLNVNQIFDDLMDTIFTSSGNASVKLNGYSNYQNVWSGNPYQPMNIIITSALLTGEELAFGSEIALFDTTANGNHICVGSGRVTDSISTGNPLTIIASMDDIDTPETDGFTNGHSMIFKIWNYADKQEHTVINATFMSGFDEAFIGLGTAIVEVYASQQNDQNTIEDITIANGQTECYDATNTIIVAGSGTTVDILSGGEATFVAGERIHLKPGFHAHSGSYGHGYITTTGEYCQQPQPMVAVETLPIQEADITTELIADEDVGVKIYPNPTSGNFTIDFKGKSTSADIFLMNLNGNCVLETKCRDENKKALDISHLPGGMYAIIIKIRKRIIREKIIKNN